MLLKLQVVEPDPELIDVAYRPRMCPEAHTVIVIRYCRLDRSVAFREAEGYAEWRDAVFRTTTRLRKLSRRISLGSLTPGRRRLG